MKTATFQTGEEEIRSSCEQRGLIRREKGWPVGQGVRERKQGDVEPRGQRWRLERWQTGDKGAAGSDMTNL